MTWQEHTIKNVPQCDTRPLEFSFTINHLQLCHLKLEREMNEEKHVYYGHFKVNDKSITIKD